MTKWHFQPVGNYWLVGALALMLVGLLIARGAAPGTFGRWRRMVLTALRGAVLLLAVLAMLRPTLVYTITTRQRPTLVVLIDQSRSMSVSDAFGGKTRWESLRSGLATATPELKALARDLDVRLYTFDADLHPLDFSRGNIKLPSRPTGEQTAIGRALEEVLRREAGKRLAGVIVLSDGTQRAYAPRDLPPQTPARRLAELGYPLYTLAFGQSRGLGQTRDAAVKDLQVNQTVFVKNELTVAGTVQLDGFASQKIPVRLLFESPDGRMHVVGSTQLVAARHGQAIPFSISYLPETPGEYKVTVEIEEQPGEVLTTNNQLSSFVTVLKGGVNVLYVEGKLRVEQKFVRQSLDASPDIQVDYLRIDPQDLKTRPADLLARLQPGKYDLYIIGDLDSTAWTARQLKQLADTVGRGAGLMMLGGQQSFGPGGYAATPLAAVLPVELDRFERQPLDDPVREDVHHAGPLAMLPADPLGKRHYLMALSADRARNGDIWRELPPLDGANRFGSLKPSASVLAQTPDGDPLLVTHEAGGRVLAFAGDSTWRWVLAGHAAEHKRFWRQVILWLARRDELSDGNVWIKLAPRRFSPGSRVEFTVGAQDAHRTPVDDATFSAEVVAPGNQRQGITLARGNQFASGAVGHTTAAGDYAIEVRAAQGDTELGRARARFIVSEQDLELDNAVADPNLLANLSQITQQAGGEAIAPEELPDLLSRLKARPLELETQQLTKTTPWDTWPFLLAFVALLSTEWALRKRWGLV